jgi:hypothetical protein
MQFNEPKFTPSRLVGILFIASLCSFHLGNLFFVRFGIPFEAPTLLLQVRFGVRFISHSICHVQV